MFNFGENDNDQKDACEICEEQSAFIAALTLDRACMQIGK